MPREAQSSSHSLRVLRALGGFTDCTPEVLQSKSGRGLPRSIDRKKAGHCCPAFCKNWRLLSHSELLPDGAVEPGISRINRQRARASDVGVGATCGGRRLECAFEGEGHLASSTTGGS